MVVWYYLFFKPGIFYAKLLFIESYLAEHCRTTTIRTYNTTKRGLKPVILVLQVVILSSQYHIIRSVLLCLPKKQRKKNDKIH